MNAAAADTVPCPQCGTARSADAPDGLCPRCLLGLGVGGPPHDLAGDDAGEESAPSGGKPEVVAADAMARRFPQLEILECLGRGGMGVVYKARQPRLNRLVALKVLAPGREQEPRFAERFAREARALARLAHPAIVAIHDFGESDGLFYLVMEYVDGTNLRSLIRDRKVPPANALSLVPVLCEALQFAHEQGVVHRDIKPENILIDTQGRVKIADFGIAKLLGPAGLSEPLTEARRIIGTPHYMAPEQVEHPAAVDHRADIYSLGVVFYELLTGELPLGKFAPPSHKAGIDPRLDAVVLRSLEKEPGQRYQRAGDLKVEVDSVRETLPDSPSEPTLATESRGVETRPDIDASRVPPTTPDPNASASVRHLRIAAAGLTVAALANLLVGSLVLAGA
ncbi:MAG: serine/threonine-protein kinase, partial [Limisphaerales bacterium]